MLTLTDNTDYSALQDAFNGIIGDLINLKTHVTAARDAIFPVLPEAPPVE